MFMLSQLNDRPWFLKPNPVGRTIQSTSMTNPTSHYTHLHRGKIPVDIHRPGLRPGQADGLNLSFVHRQGLATPPHHDNHNTPLKSALGCWASCSISKFFGTRRGLGHHRNQDPQQEAASIKLMEEGLSGTVASSEPLRSLPLESVLGRYQANNKVVYPATGINSTDQQRPHLAEEQVGNDAAFDRCSLFSFPLSAKPLCACTSCNDDYCTNNLYPDSSPLSVTSSLVHSHDEILPPSSGGRTPNKAWYDTPAFQTPSKDKYTGAVSSDGWFRSYLRSPSPSSSSSYSSASIFDGYYDDRYSAYHTDGSYYDSDTQRLWAPEEYEGLRSKWSPFDNDEAAEYASDVFRVRYMDDTESINPESHATTDGTSVSDAISSSAFLSSLLLLPPIGTTKTKTIPVAAPPPNAMTGLPDRGYKPYPIILAPVATKPGLMRNVVEGLTKLVSEDSEELNDLDFYLGSDSDCDSEAGRCDCSECDLRMDSEQNGVGEGEWDKEEEEETILYMSRNPAQELARVIPSSNSSSHTSTLDRNRYPSRTPTAPAAVAPFQPLTAAPGMASSIWCLRATERQQYKN